MCTDSRPTEPNCWWGKNIVESFITSHPWREPESAEFHREIWSTRGSTHTHTTTWTSRTEKQTLTESDSSILLNAALGVGCIFNTNLFNILALIPCTIGGDSHTPPSHSTSDTHKHTHTHRHILIRWPGKCTNTCASTHTVCNLRNLSIPLSLSVNSQKESVPRMVPLPGTRPQAVSKKCQLSINAATYLTKI